MGKDLQTGEKDLYFISPYVQYGLTSFTTIQLSVNVTPQAIYINHMAM